MLVINEWLPNPKGTDTKLEWIELHNSGTNAVSLAGWRLTGDGKKFFILQGRIEPGAYVVLPRARTKITLKNTDGRLALYDPSGRLADQASFAGSAPEGESANRAETGAFFGQPTPGKANAHAAAGPITYHNEYPIGVPLAASMSGSWQLLGALTGTALALAAAVVFILKSHEDPSHIFFKGDPGPGRGRS